jgi:hypothetical protein
MHSGGDAHPDPHFVVEGEGWGHLIGMSQFGSQAMAEDGAGYTEILAHYYGGLTPVGGAQFLPDEVAVGLVIGADSVSISTNSVLEVTLDGVELEVPDPGVWKFKWEEGRLVVVPAVLDRQVPPGAPYQPF